MRATLLLAVVGFSACAPPGFTGDAGTIFFTTPLSRDYQAFTPWQPVAQGTHLTFKAEQQMPYAFFQPIDPRALATASGGAVTTDGSGVNQWSGWAVAPGKARLSWSGRVTDEYELAVAPAASIELVDPLSYYADEGYTPHHRAFPEVGHEVWVAPGSWIFFELVPRSEGGVALAFEPGWISVDGGSGFAVDAGGHGVNLVAPSGPATSTITVSAGDSGVVETFTLVTPADAAAEVSRLELEAVPTETNGRQTALFVLVAKAYRADGGVLWVPPVEWTLDPHLVDQQTKNATPVQITLPHRNDVRVVSLQVLESASASVSYAGLDASVTVTLPHVPLPDAGAPAPETPAPTPMPSAGCGGCSTGGGPLGVLALALAGAVRRCSRRE